jgi:hypothetical protein
MLFILKYSLVALISIFIGSFSAAGIVFPLIFGKNEDAAESGNKDGINIVSPIIWIGIVYLVYLALVKYLTNYLILAVIIYVVSFIGTIIKGFKEYK